MSDVCKPCRKVMDLNEKYSNFDAGKCPIFTVLKSYEMVCKLAVHGEISLMSVNLLCYESKPLLKLSLTTNALAAEEKTTIRTRHYHFMSVGCSVLS